MAEEKSMQEKLYETYPGKVVRKDLTRKIKEGANVPVYVLEYLLGMYCASQKEEEIQAGLEDVKRILANNYVRPDEAQKILSRLQEQGSFTVIDKVSVKLNIRYDMYEAEFSNLGLKGVPVDARYPTDYDRLL